MLGFVVWGLSSVVVRFYLWIWMVVLMRVAGFGCLLGCICDLVGFGCLDCLLGVSLRYVERC